LPPSFLDTALKRSVAAVVAAVLLYFTVGLHPAWPLAWIAPVPLLLAAFHAGRRETLALTAFASFLGLTSLIPYYVSVLGWPGVLLVLLQMLQWCFLVSFTRAIVRRSACWWTVFAYPVVCAALDTLISTFSPHGTWGSLAYTQMDALPVIQIASVAGTPGVVFIISLFASMVALALYRVQSRRPALFAFGVPLLIIAGAVGFGGLRLTNGHAPTKTMPIGMVAIDDVIGPKIPREEAEAIWRAYDDAIARLAQVGARVVVLPEKIDVQEPAAAKRRAALGETARRNAIYLVVGVGLTEDGQWKNRAWFFGPAGELLGEYDKQHLVPGWESAMTAGREDVVRSIDQHRFGVAICKDMHFASLGRRYGKAEVTAMLEPAWDFERDAWMAARVAAFRGVENGYAVVHAARQSVLSASDRYGRFVAETRSSQLPGAAIIAQVPIEARSPTLYARFGDWFGWLCVIGAALLRFLPRTSGGVASKS
jgi:apolipoprotein N-acyltransferase